MREWKIGGLVTFDPRYYERFIAACNAEDAKDLFVESIFEDEDFVSEIDIDVVELVEEE